MRTFWSSSAMVFVLVLGAACGGGGDDSSTGGSTSTYEPEGARASGSRLRAQLLDGGDGAALFEGWLDSEIGEPCSFATTSDGVLRCVPGWSFGLYYSDAECTHPVAIPSDCPKSAYVKELRMSDDCKDAVARVYEVGAKVGTGQRWERDFHSGACVKSGNAVDFYAATEVPPSTFVSATATLLPVDDGLTATVLDADDGSRDIDSPPTDTASGLPCHPQTFGDLRCAPMTSATIYPDGYFSDPGCMQPAAAMEPATCPAPPPIAMQIGPEFICHGQRTRFFHVGDPVPASQVHFGASCGPLDPDAAAKQAFFEVGDEIDPTTFVEMTIKKVEAKGRLALQYHATRNGITIGEPFSFFDSKEDLPCTPTPFIDGSLRCVPIDVAVLEEFRMFEDAACSVEIVAAKSDPMCPVVLPQYAVAMGVPPDCGEQPVGKLYGLGALYSGEKFYYRDPVDETCIAGVDPAVPVFELGEALDPSVFALVVPKTE